MNLKTLREANVKRCEESFHLVIAWSPTDWACAFAGEAGEVCNAVKKLRREHVDCDGLTLANHINDISDKIADTIIYADLLAARLGIDLSTAIQSKFNRDSTRYNSKVKLNTP